MSAGACELANRACRVAGGRVERWRPSGDCSGKKCRRVVCGPIAGHDGPFYDVRFAPSSRSFSAGSANSES